MVSKIEQYRQSLQPLIIGPPPANRAARFIPQLPPYWKCSIQQNHSYYHCIAAEVTVIKMYVFFHTGDQNYMDISIHHKYMNDKQLCDFLFEYHLLEPEPGTEPESDTYTNDNRMICKEIENYFKIIIYYKSAFDIPVTLDKVKQLIQKIYIGDEYQAKKLWTCMELPNTRGLTRRWYRHDDELTVNFVYDKIYFRYTIKEEKYYQHIQLFHQILYSPEISHYFANNKVVYVVPHTQITTLHEKVDYYNIFLSLLLHCIQTFKDSI